MLAHLLFTNTDLGHRFEDSDIPKLIAKIVDRVMRFERDFTFDRIGAGATESTGGSLVPYYYQTYRYVYVIDARTYQSISTLVECLKTADHVNGTSN